MKSFFQTIKVLTRVIGGRAAIIRTKDESYLMLFTSIGIFLNKCLFMDNVCGAFHK